MDIIINIDICVMMTFVHINFNIIIGASCVLERRPTAFMIYTRLETAQPDPAISIYLFIQLRQVYTTNYYLSRSGSRTGEPSGESKRRSAPTDTLTAPMDPPAHLAWVLEVLVGLLHPPWVDLSPLLVTWRPPCGSLSRVQDLHSTRPGCRAQWGCSISLPPSTAHPHLPP